MSGIITLLVSGQAPEDDSTLLADTTWLYGDRVRVASRFRDHVGEGEATHVASLEVLPARLQACPPRAGG